MMSTPPRMPLTDETVFAGALERAADERRAFLLEVCLDTAQRARIESLLKAYDEAGGAFMATAGVAPRLEIAGEGKPGTMIGRYKLLQKIGEGGCGIVYMAEQEEPVRRRVALKVIKLGMDTKEVIARFEAERQALALMDHPNIARVFDGGATESGRPFFVMELVRGVPITKFCDEQNLPTRTRLELFTRVCHAVQHAHQKGVIHRDLKPSNILVTLHDGMPVPKVIDFGIAKATAGRLTDRTLFTAFEQFIGTPAYMSPEQAELSGLDVDTRSDIYSLGVLLYELLAGRPPFDPKSLVGAGLDEIRRIIREVDPPRPSTRLSTLTGPDRATIARQRGTAPGQLSTLLRGDLDWIVMRCLEKDRTRRYETANALALDVLRHLHDEAVLARPPSAGYRLAKLVRRNKAVFATVALVTIALAGGAALATWAFWRERAARQQAAAAERLVTLEARKSREVARFLEEMLAGVGPGVALGRDTRLLREILDKTAERMSTDLQGQPEVEVELRATLGRVYSQIGYYEKAQAMLRQALRLRGPAAPGDARWRVQILAELTQALLQTERLVEAEQVGRQCVALVSRDPTARLAWADMLGTLAWIQAQRGNYREAEANVLKSIRIIEHGHPVNESVLASILNTFAMLRGSQQRYEESEALHRRALALRQKILPPEHPEIHESMNNLAVTLSDPRLQKLGEANALYQESISAARRVLGPEHPATAVRMLNFATFLRSQKKMPEAETLLREAFAVFNKAFGPDHPETTRTRCMLGDLQAEQGRLAEAEGNLSAAMQTCARVSGAASVEYSGVLLFWGSWLNRSERPVEAATAFREALAIRKSAFGLAHPQTIQALSVLGGHLARQQPAEAEPIFRQLVEARKEMFSPRHASVADAMERLAEVVASPARVAGAGFDEAARLFAKIADMRREQGDEGRQPLVRALNGLARMQGLGGDYAAAEKTAAEAVGIARGLGPTARSELSVALTQFGTAASQLGKSSAAESAFTEAAKLEQAESAH